MYNVCTHAPFFGLSDAVEGENRTQANAIEGTTTDACTQFTPHLYCQAHCTHTHTHHQYSVRNACAHTNITSTKLPLSNCCPGLLSLTMSAGLRRPACPITGLLRDGYTPPDLPPFGSALAVPSRVCFIVFALAHALTGTCHLF